MRLAAAKVYSCNIGDETVGDRCIENLRSLFSDESEDVRNKAALCFSYLEEEDLREFSEVIRAYVQSPAFPSQHDCLLRCLEKSVNQLPDLTVELARKFIAVAGEGAKDPSKVAAFNSQEVSNLVVRLYSQSSDADLQKACLDLVDEMERMAFYGIDKQLAENDR